MLGEKNHDNQRTELLWICNRTGKVQKQLSLFDAVV